MDPIKISDREAGRLGRGLLSSKNFHRVFFLTLRATWTRILIIFIFGLIPWDFIDNRLLDERSQILHHIKNDQKPKSSQIIPVVLDREDLRRFGDATLVRNYTFFEPESSMIRDMVFYYSELNRLFFREVLRKEPTGIVFAALYPQGVFDKDFELQKYMRDPRVVWSAPYDDIRSSQRPAQFLGLKHVKFGFSDISPDEDGTVRRYVTLKERLPSVLSALLKDQGSADLPKNFIINFRHPLAFQEHCSFTDLILHTRKFCSDLKNKILIVSLEQALPWPTTTIGRIPYSIQLANALDNILVKDWIREVPKYVRIMLGAFAAAMVATLSFFYRTTVVTVAGVGVVLVAGFVSFLLQNYFHLHYALGELIAMVIASFAAFVSYRANLQEKWRWRAAKQAQYLRQVDELKSNFISLISHELKTPIAKIQALSERLLRTRSAAITDDEKKIVHGILLANSELKTHIQNMLNFANVESGKLNFKSSSLDLNEITAEVVNRLSILATEKKIEIHTDFTPLFPVSGDESLLKQVVSIVIENAIKYSPPSAMVYVETGETDKYIFLKVKDTGRGIPPEFQDLIFEKFVRGPTSEFEAVKGTGLGLYLARYFVEMHGGKLELTSHDGTGAQFTMFLPVA